LNTTPQKDHDEKGIAINKAPQFAGCKKPKSIFDMKFDQISLHLDLIHNIKDWGKSQNMGKVQKAIFHKSHW
jgi:hypothetical protein